MVFLIVPGGFSYLINNKSYNSNWKNLLGFRNMQEKFDLFLQKQKNKMADSIVANCQFSIFFNTNLNIRRPVEMT